MDIDVAPIEAKITTEIGTYQEKLQEYEQAFINATQRKHYPNEADSDRLRQTWQTLQLKAEDVAAIEARITTEIDAYQRRLSQYEQEFTKATQQQYPLSEAKQQELSWLQQVLVLTDRDIAPIQARIANPIEQRLQKLQQYEQVLTEYVQYEYSLSDEVRRELQRFQQILELEDEDALQIEQQVLAKLPAASVVVQDSELNVDLPSAQQQPTQEKKAQPVQVKKSVELSPTQKRSPDAESPVSSTDRLSILTRISEKVSSTISNKFQLAIGVGVGAIAALFLIPMATRMPQNLLSTTVPAPTINRSIDVQNDRDRSVLAQAQSLARQNNFELAMQKAQEIAVNSPIYDEAKQQILLWQAQDLENYLQNDYPQKYLNNVELRKHIIEFKPEVLVENDRVSIRVIYSKDKDGDTILKQLTLVYMEALMGSKKSKSTNFIPPKYTKFSQLVVYSQQSRHLATLLSKNWQDYLDYKIPEDQLINKIKITDRRKNRR